MAARNTTPVFTNTPRLQSATLATANTNLDGTGTIVDGLTGAAEGTLITGAVLQAVGTTTAGLISVFVHDGTAYRLIDQVAVSAATPSATVAAWRAVWTPPDTLILPSASWKIAYAPTNTEDFRVITIGQDYS